jgi:inosine-uridine nucleoside N-ribohydrolase
MLLVGARKGERKLPQPLTHGGHARHDTAGVPTSIILDCDPGHDDAVAILLALASPEVELVGVTTVHGNQTLDKTTLNALKVLELVGRVDVPVARGADRPLVRELVVADHVHGDSGLDGPSLPEPSARPVDAAAVSFLAEQLGPGVVLVPTGPLTNVALLLERYPEARPERIVLMGGAIGLGNVTPAAEFNVWADPEAAAAVLASGIDITMVGLDVTHQAIVGPERVARFRGMGRIGAVVAELLDFFTLFHRETYGWAGSPVHDALAVASVIRPELLELAYRRVVVETESELCRGRTVVDLYPRAASTPNAHVAVGVNSAAFLDMLEERIARLD